MTFDAVLAAIEARDLRVRRHDRQAEAQCPAHDDRNASLSVGIGDDERILMHCHAGCQTPDVLAALGLEPRDLFADSRHSNGNGRPKTLATYDYQDEHGTLVYQVVRLQPKAFRQRRPDGNGGWIWKLDGVRRVLYRLPLVNEAVKSGKPIWVVEGEKDVAALERAGEVATCNPGGAGKWRPEYAEALRGAQVTIIADKDAAGLEHARDVAHALQNVADTIQISEAAEGKDAADHLAAGHGVHEFVPIDLTALDDETAGLDSATDDAEPATSYLRTDVGNAQRLVDRHGRDLLFIPGLGRYHFDHGRYAPDDSGEWERRAKSITRDMIHDAARIENDEDRKQHLAHALRTESEPRLRAMTNLATSEQAILARVEQLDANPMLMNVANGTLDLTTGQLRPHAREDRLTRLSPVRYDPHASCPRWEAFIERIFNADRELIAYVRRVFGYCMTGSTREQVLPICWGSGANGKTTLIETVSLTLGEYARHTPSSTLLEHRNDAIPNDLARLRGVRLVTASETGDGRRLNEERVKDITGGGTITARFMRGEWFEFEPAFKVMLCTNHLPRIRGTEHAIWRRIRLVPFAVTIPDNEQDRDLPDKLRAELPGILNWLLHGCLDWQHTGLTEPGVVRQATAGYRTDMDVLGRFIEERCTTEHDTESDASELWRAFCEWCEHNHEKAGTQTSFGRQLAERGYEASKSTRGTRTRLGIRLTESQR